VPDTFLTVAEVAELLKLNRQTVYNYLDRVELPAVRVGARRVRIKQSDLDAFLNTSPPPTDDDASGLLDADARAQLDGAIEDVSNAVASDDRAVLASALRQLARVATDIADTVQRDEAG
jgi:excisionase family DNA binding protein